MAKSQAYTHERRWCLVLVTGFHFHMGARAVRHKVKHNHAATAEVATRGRLCLCRFSPTHDYNLPPPPSPPYTPETRHVRKLTPQPLLSLSPDAAFYTLHSTGACTTISLCAWRRCKWAHPYSALTQYARAIDNMAGTFTRPTASDDDTHKHCSPEKAEYVSEFEVVVGSHRHNHSSRVGRGGN